MAVEFNNIKSDTNYANGIIKAYQDITPFFVYLDLTDNYEIENSENGKCNIKYHSKIHINAYDFHKCNKQTPHHITWEGLKQCYQTTKYPTSIYSNLRIVNLNSQYDIESKIIKHICNVITKGDLQISAETPLGLSGLNDDMPFWMSYLKTQIIVYLVNEHFFEQIKDELVDNHDTLGCYYSAYKFGNEERPTIFLCPEKIKKIANPNVFDERLLYEITIIHEFAHAIMDETNNIDDNGYFQKSKADAKPKIPNYTQIEESLANLITLQYIATADKSKLEKAKKFMLTQPYEYKLGVDKFDGNCEDHISWQDWRNEK